MLITAARMRPRLYLDHPRRIAPLHTFELPKGTDKHYVQQFADMYFLRLSQLRKSVKQRAEEAWNDFEVWTIRLDSDQYQDDLLVLRGADVDKLGGERASFVERVLDVRQGQLCWIVGTVYMEMALKPNVLDDISKEV